ncbi:sphingolipid C9-methyltransferase-like protein [Ramicandelaber brevisporus]|nr:sphingolipid C9-methyltransferase-like protein [Ramicandelaber brevisporus]
MIYTSGIITDTTRKQSIDELQENKLRLVCEKLQLKPGERHLDIGCGWGTLAVYAAKHYKTQSTGVTLARNQTAYGNNRAKANKVDNLAKIICTDYRDVPATPRFNKISCLEMAEHVGIRRFTEFLTQVREMMDDDGLFFLQIAGLRAAFQFEDFVWGLFMNKYVFPGADASCPLNWVIGKLEHAGFEIRSTETLGVHYSATIHRWYENWMKNKDKMVKAYGKRWFHIWEIFLAWSTIVARQGNSTVFQIVAHKNRNAFDRTSLIKSDDNSPVRELSVI